MQSDLVIHYPFPSTSTSPPHSLISPPRNQTDECFNCARLGHWATECPNKSPKKSTPSSPCSDNNNGDVKNGSVSHVVRCPCGRGFCLIFISRTSKNPNRLFYTCPAHTKWGKCGFFMWCDELSDIVARAPECPCGAGICSLNKASPSSSGTDGETWYFACRVKKNLGACDFVRSVDFDTNSMNNSNGHESKRYSSLLSGLDAANNELDEGKMSPRISIESQLVHGAENSQDLPVGDILKDQDDIPYSDVIVPEEESLNMRIVEPLQVFQPKVQPLNPLKESWRHIYVAGNTITKDVIYQSLGCHVYGWLGRIAYPPSQHLKDPPAVPVVVCIFPSSDPVTLQEYVNLSDNETSFHSLHEVANAETGIPSSGMRSQDSQLPAVVASQALELKASLGTSQANNISKESILKTFGQVLIDQLESMNTLGCEHMLKLAEPTFMAFQNLSIECCPLVEGLRRYIHSMSVLASVERSINEGLSFQELIKRHENEKLRFDDVSCLHAEAEAAYATSNNHIQSLRTEVSRLKSILVDLEKQLAEGETETSLLKALVNEAAENMLKSKTSMDATSNEITKVLELEQKRVSMRGAATSALETARAWLEDL